MGEEVGVRFPGDAVSGAAVMLPQEHVETGERKASRKYSQKNSPGLSPKLQWLHLLRCGAYGQLCSLLRTEPHTLEARPLGEASFSAKLSPSFWCFDPT